jgi:hypothetical protein
VGDNDEIYCWDSEYSVIRKITDTTVDTYAGSGYSGFSFYSFGVVNGLVWFNSSLYVLDYFSDVSFFRQITSNGVISLSVYGAALQPVYSPTWDQQYGKILVILGTSQCLGGFDPDNGNT